MLGRQRSPLDPFYQNSEEIETSQFLTTFDPVKLSEILPDPKDYCIGVIIPEFESSIDQREDMNTFEHIKDFTDIDLMQLPSVSDENKLKEQFLSTSYISPRSIPNST